MARQDDDLFVGSSIKNMKIDYAESTADWEDWMFEYRYGAFYIFPTDDHIEAIDGLRQTLDPKSARICQSHISLTEPLTKPLTAKLVSEISVLLNSFEPFEIDYGPLKTFPPHPGVCLDILPKNIFFTLRRTLHTCSAFTGSDFGRKDIAPHITIAEFGLTWEDSEALRKRLDGQVPGGKFLCSSIEYAVPNDDFVFERILKIPL